MIGKQIRIVGCGPIKCFSCISRESCLVPAHNYRGTVVLSTVDQVDVILDRSAYKVRLAKSDIVDTYDRIERMRNT